MVIKFGEGTTKDGPGVDVRLTGDEVAIAVDEYLASRGVDVSGPRTIRVNGELCEAGHVYVDPIGSITFGGKKYSGRGETYLTWQH